MSDFNQTEIDELPFEERLALLEKKVARDQRQSRWRRKKEGNKPVQNLAHVLPTLQKALGLDQKVQELALLSVWSHVVDARFKDVTKPFQIKTEGHKKILMVAVAHGVIGTELSFSLPQIKTKLNSYQAQTGLVVDDIRFLVRQV